MSVRTKVVAGIFATGQALGPYGLGKERYKTTHTHSTGKSSQDMTGSVILKPENQMIRKQDAERKQEYFPNNKLNNIDDEDNSKYVMVADNAEKLCVVPQSVLDNPPSVVEVQAATAAIFSSGDAFGQLFGSLTFDKDQMVELFQGVLKVATNPHIIAEAKRNREEYLLKGSDYFRDEEEAQQSSFSDAETSTPPLDTKHNISAMDDKATSASPLSQTSGESAVWRSMAEDITCALCVDVFACPVLLRPCSHEFCGMCIHDLASACTSKDVEVSHRCPVCRVEFTSSPDDVTYQQIRDEMICRELRFAPDCQEKTEWAEKRGAFLKLREANKVQQEEEKNEETEKKEEKSFFGSLNLEFSSETIQNAVVVMAVAVLCLIAVMRK